MESEGYDPQAGGELDWRDAGRHEKPSVHDQEETWAKR